MMFHMKQTWVPDNLRTKCLRYGAETNDGIPRLFLMTESEFHDTYGQSDISKKYDENILGWERDRIHSKQEMVP